MCLIIDIYAWIVTPGAVAPSRRCERAGHGRQRIGILKPAVVLTRPLQASCIPAISATSASIAWRVFSGRYGVAGHTAWIGSGWLPQCPRTSTSSPVAI